MNKLWRFGDSYSQTDSIKYPHEKNHSYWIAKHFGLEYIDLGEGGLSILDCLLRMIEASEHIQSGDMILFNMPYTERLGFFDKMGVLENSSGHSIDELFSNEKFKKLLVEESHLYINYTLIGIIAEFLKNKIKNKVEVYTFVNSVSDFEFNLPNKVRFEESSGLIKAIQLMGYEDFSDDGNVHYLYGVQKNLAERIINVITNFKNQGN